MFIALQGGCWHVDSANPVVVQSPNQIYTIANAFTTGGGCTSLTSSGNGPVNAVILFIFHPNNSTLNNSNVMVSFKTPNGLGEKYQPMDTTSTSTTLSCQSITAATAWNPLPTPTYDSTTNYWSWDTPLVINRGSIMIRCTNSA